MSTYRRVPLLARHDWPREGCILHGHVAERMQHMPIAPAPVARDDTPSVLSMVGLALVTALAMAGALLF